jgi:hypothetical protein
VADGVPVSPCLLLIIVNFKLINLVRDITRGCQLRVLHPSCFWFGSPHSTHSLLWAIRVSIFMVAFSIGSLVFFAWVAAVGPCCLLLCCLLRGCAACCSAACCQLAT